MVQISLICTDDEEQAITGKGGLKGGDRINVDIQWIHKPETFQTNGIIPSDRLVRASNNTMVTPTEKRNRCRKVQNKNNAKKPKTRADAGKPKRGVDKNKESKEKQQQEEPEVQQNSTEKEEIQEKNEQTEDISGVGIGNANMVTTNVAAGLAQLDNDTMDDSEDEDDNIHTMLQVQKQGQTGMSKKTGNVTNGEKDKNSTVLQIRILHKVLKLLRDEQQQIR